MRQFRITWIATISCHYTLLMSILIILSIQVLREIIFLLKNVLKLFQQYSVFSFNFSVLCYNNIIMMIIPSYSCNFLAFDYRCGNLLGSLIWIVDFVSISLQTNLSFSIFIAVCICLDECTLSFLFMLILLIYTYKIYFQLF